MATTAKIKTDKVIYVTTLSVWQQDKVKLQLQIVTANIYDSTVANSLAIAGLASIISSMRLADPFG
jgi:hypothetical protein